MFSSYLLPVVLYWFCFLLSTVLKCEINALKRKENEQRDLEFRN